MSCRGKQVLDPRNSNKSKRARVRTIKRSMNTTTKLKTFVALRYEMGRLGTVRETSELGQRRTHQKVRAGNASGLDLDRVESQNANNKTHG